MKDIWVGYWNLKVDLFRFSVTEAGRVKVSRNVPVVSGAAAWLLDGAFRIIGQ